MSNPELGPEAAYLFSKVLYRTVAKAFEDPTTRKRYADDYLKRYGVPYVWKGRYARMEREAKHV